MLSQLLALVKGLDLVLAGPLGSDPDGRSLPAQSI